MNRLCYVCLLLLMECAGPDPTSTDQVFTSDDSVALTTLVRKVYAWHEKDFRRNGFPFQLVNPADSFFSGVDWESYNRDMEVVRGTGFFSDAFFETRKAIALRLDSSIHEAKVEWRLKNDGISIWDPEVDEWNGAQDYPFDYWDSLTLHQISYSQNEASFFWTWGQMDGMQPNRYRMRARKEAGFWRISHIEGFDYYGTREHYRKLMQGKPVGRSVGEDTE